jgi:DNA-directed RNA polymerase specialized sigma24 family protein
VARLRESDPAAFARMADALTRPQRRAIDLHQAGNTMRGIAERMGIAKPSVSTLLKRAYAALTGCNRKA